MFTSKINPCVCIATTLPVHLPSEAKEFLDIYIIYFFFQNKKILYKIYKSVDIDIK